MILLDDDRNVLFANAAVQRTLGYPPEELVGSDFGERVLMTRHGPTGDMADGVVSTGQRFDVELCLDDGARRRGDERRVGGS